jgi:hypothetical protein
MNLLLKGGRVADPSRKAVLTIVGGVIRCRDF